MKNVFISYSHKDEEYKNQLIAHLSGLVRNKIIHLWDDRQIKIGDSWDATIKNKLEESDVAIFLISSDFLSSSYINEVEIKKTLERHSKGEILLIPVFLRPCDFESSEFSSLQGVPRDARFVVEFPNIDSAFLSIVKELKSLINNFEPVAKVTAIPQKETSNNLLSTNNQWDNCDSPPDIFKWVGRKKELEIINNDLFKVLFITGLGGQGKSSLAAAYILNKNMSHSWIQWDWRDFKEEGHRLKSKLIEIICRFSRDYDDVDFNDIPFPNLYDIFFQAIHGKKIIFVFDNIDAYIDYEKFIPEHDFRIFIEYILQKNHECRFIFTCRPFIKQADVGFFQIELKGFPYEESVELLEQYNISIRNTEKDKLYQELHNLTQGHPLWLNLLAAQATRGIDKLEEFISNITKGVNRGDLTETSIVSERILGELWKSLNNKQKILLRCLSELIKSEEKDEIAKIIAGELNYNQFTRALNNLKLLNLVVTKTKPGREEEIELHPLVKNFLKYILPLNEQSKYISIIIDYYDKVTYILKKRLSGNETLQFYEKWTNKVELAINKRDYRKALVTLEEISVPIQTAGFIEEFFRVTKLTYDSIDFNKAIENEYPNFISTLSSIVTIASELGNFNYAEQTIKRYADIVKNKGYHYIILCELYCKYYWNKLDYEKSIEWGDKGLLLLKQSEADITVDIEHTLYLAKRDSRNKERIKEALDFFLRGYSLYDIINDNIQEELPSYFYGNIGRCLYLSNDFNNALICYQKTFTLVYKEEISSRYINRGYIAYWLGQLLNKMGDYKNAYFFYSICIFYWKRYSPHRISRVEDELVILLRETPEATELKKIDIDIIEGLCKSYCSNTISS